MWPKASVRITCRGGRQDDTEADNPGSVNHQNVGDGDILIYPNAWQVDGGQLDLDQETYNNIVSSGLAKSDTNRFTMNTVSKYPGGFFHVYPEASYTSLMIAILPSARIF